MHLRLVERTRVTDDIGLANTLLDDAFHDLLRYLPADLPDAEETGKRLVQPPWSDDPHVRQVLFNVWEVRVMAERFRIWQEQAESRDGE